eukprot:CAMPEP_0182601544 /NCGR_PEP_ID=MMETSP1324-20130603/91536_1 /TAXON_ID=236786 /ORGANISM="Florenciella sp., Strain RCC1587" /LENGTH=341 /DNA_ID=CAMNT_0024819455 /DNA_START=795 /DNA_END=1817 /DNA_ORIENTATION=-
MSTQLNKIASYVLHDIRHDKLDMVMKADLTLEALFSMDEDGDGTITEYEFIKFMLTKSELIDEGVLDNLHNQFTKLDVDGSGEITRQDIELRDSKVLETPTRRNDNSEQPGATSPQSDVSSLSPSSRSSGRSQESGSPARSRNTSSRRSPSPTMTDGTREGQVDAMVAAYRKFPAQTVRTPSSPPSSPWDDTATNPANGDLSFAQASITRLRRVAEGLDTPEEKEEKVGREEEGLVDNQRKETKEDDGGTGSVLTNVGQGALHTFYMVCSLESRASDVQLTRDDLVAGDVLPSGLFGSLVGRAVQWAKAEQAKAEQTEAEQAKGEQARRAQAAAAAAAAAA